MAKIRDRMMQKPKNVEAYIVGFPKSTQALLQQIRTAIRAVAPDAEEVISYGMPTLKQSGVLVHYAAYSQHIGFYATPTGHAAFADELSGYKQGKGSVQFPLDQPMPLELIKRIVAFRLEENLKK